MIEGDSTRRSQRSRPGVLRWQTDIADLRCGSQAASLLGIKALDPRLDIVEVIQSPIS